MKTNGKYRNLLKADKKSVLTTRNIVLASIVVVSVVLLISFFSSLAYSDTSDTLFSSFTDTDLTTPPRNIAEVDGYYIPFPEIGTVFVEAAGIIITLPLWGIGSLISSSVGFSLLIINSTLSKTMLLENKKWLKTWTKKGTITSHYMFKRVQIKLGANKISIMKLKNKYRFKIPITEGLDLAKYGFSTKNNYYVGYFEREELSSTIHLVTTQM
ncbi:MAG: hypothetical protein ACTSQF_11890 [Candidatus Heimdallarchaeaceae archaeon]